MTLTPLKFQPGINKDLTDYANKGGWYACDKIRFRLNYPEKIGGWSNWSSTSGTFSGICRTIFPWVTYTSENLVAVGTNQKYYIANGGAYYDITPLRATFTSLSNPFTTTSGSPLVTVSITGHGAAVGSYVTFSGVSTFNGVTMNGQYEIISVPDANTFTVIAGTTASASGSGGGTVTAVFQINAGNSVALTVGGGWGVGGWGTGGWGNNAGIVSSTTLPLNLWSQCNTGQDLVFANQYSVMYYWVKDTTTYAAGVTLSSYVGGNTIKTSKLTTQSSAAGTTTITVTDNFQIDSGAVVSGTNIAAGTYVSPSWNGSPTVPLLNPNVVSTSIITGSGVTAGATINFSYSQYAVPNEVGQIFSDPNGFVINVESTSWNPSNFNTAFDPMMVRWSDQNNPYEWVPATYNQAGSQHLQNGSYLVAGRATRQENLIWSNSALYSMQYVGPPYVFSFTPLADNISIASPNAAITVNNITYWMGVDQFYIYSGSVQPLNCTLRNWVFKNLNSTQLNQVICGVNAGFHEIWWHYPSSSSQVNDSYVVYNYVEQTWYYGSLNRTAWNGSSLFQPYPVGVFSIQTSYLQLAVTASQTTLTLVNGASYPATGTVKIDSEQISYTGVTGNTLTGCTRGVNGTTAASHNAYATVYNIIPNQLMNHEYGYDDVSTGTAVPIPAYVQSADVEIGDGHNFTYIWRMIPDLTFNNSTVSNPFVNMIVTPRNNPGSTYMTGLDTLSYSGTAYTTGANAPLVTASQTPPVSPKIYPIEQYTGQVYTRVRGRQFNFQIQSTGLGVAWRLGNPRVDMRQDGRR
jgi:hypothetical protein